MRIIIEKNTPYRTVKEYLKYELQLSSATVSALKKREGGIRLNGEPVTVRCPLTVPCVLELAVGDTEADKNPFIEPEPIPLDIVYEDTSLVVLNKPPHMPTHPSLGHRSGTLANALAYHSLQTRGSAFVFRPINRLDRDTSGIVLCAYDRVSAARYARLLAEGEFQKTYIAAVQGELRGSGCVELPIRRAQASIILRQVCSLEDEGAEGAKTEYVSLATNGSISVLRLTPVTGRTHQLRVHMAAIGHPILGDRLYGTEDPDMPRQALHAWKLEIRDGEENRCFCAPVPEDIQARVAIDIPSFNWEELL